MNQRIYTFGASGSGTTTLAKALAEKLRLPHFDADDYFWEKTNPPYTNKRSVEKRLELLQEDLAQQSGWVLSGSMVKWGDALIPKISLAVFLLIPPSIRLARLKARERAQHGSRVDPGGDMEKIHSDLMDWAAKYDEGGLEVRSKKMHEDWMKNFHCPVLRIEGDFSTERQVEMVLEKSCPN